MRTHVITALISALLAGNVALALSQAGPVAQPSADSSTLRSIDRRLGTLNASIGTPKQGKIDGTLLQHLSAIEGGARFFDDVADSTQAVEGSATLELQHLADIRDRLTGYVERRNDKGVIEVRPTGVGELFGEFSEQWGASNQRMPYTSAALLWSICVTQIQSVYGTQGSEQQIARNCGNDPGRRDSSRYASTEDGIPSQPGVPLNRQP